MGWLFYTDGRVQTYADEKAEIARLCTSHGERRKTELVKACKVGSARGRVSAAKNLSRSKRLRARGGASGVNGVCYGTSVTGVRHTYDNI